MVCTDTDQKLLYEMTLINSQLRFDCEEQIGVVADILRIDIHTQDGAVTTATGGWLCDGTFSTA